ncbi:DUF397 domain-containing protein [Longimycelium tulufanense]|uniref:DUF397 domain-containing protein n=1 Tax=Longimycelium tulufanense TaxID=907463 RepID=UPI00166E25C2|nr:DUF397 domain-containing protein [Longimycelium tulufanense]
MTTPRDFSRAAWRKSTRSNASAQCVEVAPLGRFVGVRDSKNPARAALTVAPAAWSSFLASVQTGRLDLA